jgi:hypothetical protein
MKSARTSNAVAALGLAVAMTLDPDERRVLLDAWNVLIMDHRAYRQHELWRLGFLYGAEHARRVKKVVLDTWKEAENESESEEEPARLAA